MAGVQNFRSALGGFNREDVVRYIEYMNNKHNAELEQLNNQLQAARLELNRVKDQDQAALKAQLEEAQARCAELEERLEQLQPQEEPEKTDEELEAYRRAERAERLARDRAAQIYSQANAALADATVRVEAASDTLTALSEQMVAKAQDAKKQLQEAVATMYAIRPEEE